MLKSLLIQQNCKKNAIKSNNEELRLVDIGTNKNRVELKVGTVISIEKKGNLIKPLRKHIILTY